MILSVITMLVSDYCQCSDMFRVWWNFSNGFMANLLPALQSKNFWKLVNIWHSYRRATRLHFWLSA